MREPRENRPTHSLGNCDPPLEKFLIDIRVCVATRIRMFGLPENYLIEYSLTIFLKRKSGSPGGPAFFAVPPEAPAAGLSNPSEKNHKKVLTPDQDLVRFGL